MNWDALSAIVEVISTIAVIVTLAYLAIQLRQNRAAANRDANRAIVTDFQRIWSDTLRDRNTNIIIRRALNEWSSLSKAEQLTAHSFLVDLVIHFDTTLSMETYSELGGDTYDAWEDSMLGFIVTSGGREWYAISRYLFVGEVRERIDTRLAEPNTLPPPVTDLPFWQLDDAERGST